MTREQAIAKAEEKWWEDKTSSQIVEVQLFEPKLCMPFDLFHKAVEECLNRPVFTHEFADMNKLQKEYRNMAL